MKTTIQTLSNIFRISLIAGTILMLNTVQAGTMNFVRPDTTMIALTSTAHNTGNDEMSAETTSFRNPMLEDNYYWVNYLKSTVKAEEDDTATGSAIDEMSNNPTFWADYLKEITATEK
jgi:hypothetical protein